VRSGSKPARPDTCRIGLFDLAGGALRCVRSCAAGSGRRARRGGRGVARPRGAAVGCVSASTAAGHVSRRCRTGTSSRRARRARRDRMAAPGRAGPVREKLPAIARRDGARRRRPRAAAERARPVEPELRRPGYFPWSNIAVESPVVPLPWQPSTTAQQQDSRAGPGQPVCEGPAAGAGPVTPLSRMRRRPGVGRSMALSTRRWFGSARRSSRTDEAPSPMSAHPAVWPNRHGRREA
jgi:hypothetical protein